MSTGDSQTNHIVLCSKFNNFEVGLYSYKNSKPVYYLFKVGGKYAEYKRRKNAISF